MTNTSLINPDQRRELQQLIAHEFWHRCDLSYKLHDAQKIVRNKLRTSPGKLFVGNIARQFGKSYLMVTEAIEYAENNPNSRIKYATAFLSDLEEFIQPAFQIILEDCPPNLKPTFKTHSSKWVFPNGSEIKLVGLDKKPNGLRGTSIDMIILDECGFINGLDYQYKSVIVPATMHRPNCKIIMISTPPDSPSHSFVQYCQKAELEGSYCTFTIYDNPMVDSSTIRELMKESGGANSSTWKREYLCQFVVDSERAIIPEFQESQIEEIPTNEYYHFYHKYVAMDTGVRDKTVILFGYWDFLEAKLIIEDEVSLNGPEVTTERIAELVKPKEKALWGDKQPFRRIADNNDLILLNSLGTQYGVHFNPTSKASLESMINQLRILVSNDQLRIHPRCTQLIGCLKYGIWNKSRKEFDRSPAYGHFDALAALIYLVRNLSKNVNPIPPEYGLSIHTHFIPPGSNKSPNAKVVKDLFAPRKKKRI